MVLAPSVDTHPKDGVDPYQKPTPERIASALIFFFVIISHLDKLFSNLYVMMLQGRISISDFASLFWAKVWIYPKITKKYHFDKKKFYADLGL